MRSATFKTFSGRCRRNRPASSVASAAQLSERTEPYGLGKKVRQLETWCLTSTETTRLIRDGERGRGDLEERSSSCARFDPYRLKGTASHRQNNDVKEVRTQPVGSNLCTSLFAVSTAVRNSHKDGVRMRRSCYGCSKTIHPAVGAHLHLPPLDLSWALTARQSTHLWEPISTSLLLISPGL